MSAHPVFTAVRQNDGKTITLNNLKSFELTASLDSPVQSLSAVFTPETPFPKLLSVSMSNGGELLFDGRLDSQKTSVSSGGTFVSIDARSKAAALLDNQAQPCVMLYAQLTAVFSRFIAPYGFMLYNPNASSKSNYLAMYTVRSGMSEWDALCYFTRRVFGITPYVKRDQIMLERPRSGAPLLISNKEEGGLRYTSVSHSLTPYNVVSRVYLRDELGQYSSAVSNSAAAQTKSVRKRYVIPPNEYIDRPGLTANQKIRRSMFDYEQAVVTLPGEINASPGCDAIIRDGYFTIYNLMVVKREFICDSAGTFTRLTLASSIYYD